MPDNAPHNALRNAVNRAIAEGAPVYENQPAYPILLKAHATPRQPATSPGRYVLRQIRADEWVTHWQNLDDGGFYWGHYSRDLAEAEEDFAQRVAEWERRYGEVKA